MRLMTKSDSCWFLEYLVETWLVGLDISKWKKSAMSKKISLWIEWNQKLGSQLQSLILKLPVIMRTLLILTSVSLRYFKADCDESEYTLIKKYTRLQLMKETQEISWWLRMSLHREK